MKLSEVVTLVTKSISPISDVHYHLYSLPSFDENQTREEVCGYEIQSNKYDVPDKCILFNKLNVRFKRVWRIDNCDENKLASTEFLPLVVNENVIDFQYCYYLLVSDKITEYLCGQNSNTSGSHKRIAPEVLLNIEVELPPMDEQRQIGKLLCALDSKIALNREINRNLEAMARQLYDYWFVQFDFPDENGKPYKSSGGKMVWNEKLKREIPEGWFADNILLISEIKVGGTPSKAKKEYWDGGTIPFFGPTDVKDSIYQLDTTNHITQAGLDHCASSLFKEGDIILTARGSIGKLVVVSKNMAMNQSCYALSPKYPNTPYLYFLSKELIEWMKAKGSGSVFKSFNAQDVENSTLCIAPHTIIDKFTALVQPIFNRMKNNSEAINELQHQRDELLPLLMNCQVSVMPTAVNCDLSHD